MSFLYTAVLSKFMPKVKVGSEDPYFIKQETGSKKKSRVKKPIPPGLSKNDAKVLKSVRSKAHTLDLAFDCCCGLQIGLAGIIQLIPWVGDIIACYLALQLVGKASKVDGGLPDDIRSKMMGNIIFDFVIGLIPIVGDLINIAYKCNSRNTLILEKYLIKKTQSGATGILSTQLSGTAGGPLNDSFAEHPGSYLSSASHPQAPSYHNTNNVTASNPYQPSLPARPPNQAQFQQGTY